MASSASAGPLAAKFDLRLKQEVVNGCLLAEDITQLNGKPSCVDISYCCYRNAEARP